MAEIEQRKMKVLIFNSLYAPNITGGAERSVQETAEAVRLQGVEPVICSTSDRSYVDQVNGIRVYYQKMPNLYWMREAGGQASLKKPLWHLIDARNPLATNIIRRIIETERPDLVHTNNLSGFSVRVWDVAAALGFPVVHTIRDHYLLCLSTTMFRRGRRCERQCLRCRVLSVPKKSASASVQAVVGISNSILRSHLERGFFGPARIKKCIYNPVTITELQNLPKPEGGRLVFGYVGQLEPSKGVEFLLERFQVLGLNNAELRLFGRGATAAYEEALARRFESPSIRFMGFSRPEKIYPQVDVIVVPSLREEAFGRIVPEANAYGIPAIVSRRGGLPEIVSNGDNGFVFDPDREGDLEEKLKLFAEEPFRTRDMSDICRKMAAEYSADKIASQYLDVYRQLVS